MTTAIEKAQEALRARREAGESVERLGPLEKARRNPASRRLAIAAMCVSCMGGGDDHVPRREIRECTAPNCPLYPLRPYQAKGAA